MTTWHQDAARRREAEAGIVTTYGHPTKWTVVEDGPNAHLCVSRCEDEAEARALLAAIQARKPFSYVLAPSGVPKVSHL